ncbi:forkhead box protein J1-B-like [Centruroides vittatus]|uniref:forkhead box protein J1-B-like n=1 Tax=Centruroides vittatus TaxID=120091 RepID=UPI00350F1B21
MPIVSKDEMAQKFQQNWREKNPDDVVADDGTLNVDDGLTSLNWLQNLNIMTKIGAPTPETPPASPISSPDCSSKTMSMLGADRSSGGESSFRTKMGCRSVAEEIDYKTNGTVKPPYSYATLICMAMKANKNKMTLSSIYKWIKENFMYYKNADPSWQNSIRHNLSLNKCFIKIPRNKDEPGKGGFWRLDPTYAESLVDGVFKKRRLSQRNCGMATTRRSRKDKVVKENGGVKALRDIIQDTPPNSAGSGFSGCDSEYQLNGMEHILNPCPNPVPKNLCQDSFQSRVIASGTVRTTDHPIAIVNVQNAEEICDLGDNLRNDLCWNTILAEADLDLVNFEKYRPDEGTVPNGVPPPTGVPQPPVAQQILSPPPLVLDDDLFSSEGSNSELASDLDLSSSCGDAIGNLRPSEPQPQPSDWWACFQQHQNELLCLPPSLLNLPTTQSTINPTVYALQHPESPSYSTFEQQANMQETPNQPWADCKAALEAAALELEDFGDLDTVHAY